MIDAATLDVVDVIAVGSAPEDVAISPGGDLLYVANSGDDNVTVIDTALGAPIGTVGVGDAPLSLAVSPDGSRVYVASSGRRPRVGDRRHLAARRGRRHRPGRDLPGGRGGEPRRFSVYVPSLLGAPLSVIDTGTHTVAGSVVIGLGTRGVAVSADSNFAYATTTSGTVAVINATTRLIVDFVAVGAGPGSLEVSPDGLRVWAVNTADDTVSVIDTNTNHRPRHRRGRPRPLGRRLRLAPVAAGDPVPRRRRPGATGDAARRRRDDHAAPPLTEARPGSYPGKVMAKLRTALYLALALLFVSLACDPGAVCGLAGSSAEKTPEAGAGGGLSGVGMQPGVFEATGLSAKGERFAAALLDAAAARTADGLSPSSAPPAPLRQRAAATPLYLSHCAFLC